MSEDARVILERMESDRRYGSSDLHAFVPEASVERLREIMHELWLDRQVERVGGTGWRRLRSQPPHRCEAVGRRAEPVTPDELFDHATFADFFK